MAEKPLYKRLKYKNIAVALAVLLLIILCISAACNGKKKDNDDDKQKGKKPAVTTVDQNKGEAGDPEKTEPQGQDGNAELLEDNYQYVALENEKNIHSGALILVNGDHEFTGKEPADVVSSYDYRTTSDGDKVMSITDSDVSAKKTVLSSLRKMLSDFKKEKGKDDVMLSKGYVSVADQKTIYENADDPKKVEAPGFSEHHTGYALDFQLDQENYPKFTGEGDYAWVNENCFKYGFIQRYPDSKSDITGVKGKEWHYRYVGAPHAQLIYENGLSFEEYIDHLKQYNREAPLYFNDYSGTRYAIYYVPASKEDSTNVDVPLHKNEKAYKYSISGNNVDGYIVTVNISAGEVEPKE